MRRILCLWLPNWPIQRLHAVRPELRRRALALYTKQSRQGEWVVACCSVAQQRGIRLGMPVSEAAAMAERPTAKERPTSKSVSPDPASFDVGRSTLDVRCSAQQIQEHDPSADRAALEQLAQACD